MAQDKERSTIPLRFSCLHLYRIYYYRIYYYLYYYRIYYYYLYHMLSCTLYIIIFVFILGTHLYDNMLVAVVELHLIQMLCIIMLYSQVRVFKILAM